MAEMLLMMIFKEHRVNARAHRNLSIEIK